MENVSELILFIKSNLLTCDATIIYKIKDICLNNYNYKPRMSEVNTIIYEWQHKLNNNIITIDQVRLFLTETLYEIVNKLKTDYIADSFKYVLMSQAHDNLQRKIKKSSEFCITINKGIIFKEFIDCYRNGYFN
jgi:hypothetical protein